MKTKLKVGVIGLGMGSGHVKEFESHPHCDVVAIADLDKERLAGVAKAHGIKATYTDPETMLSKEALDIVCIATPNKFHKPLTIAALEAGSHVLCEKPMAMNAQEAQDMLAVSEATGKRLMINFSFRFTPQSWQLKKEVESGTLGDVYFASTQWMRRRGLPGFGGWFGQKAQSGGGPLIDLGVHRLDLALWLMGYPEPAWVMGNTYNAIGSRLAEEQGKPFDVEDMAAAMIQFKDGSSLQLIASWASNIKEGELIETRLLGTEGGLVQRNLNEGYQFEAELYVERNGCQYNMQPHGLIPNVGSAMHHFADCILNDQPHTATAEEGLTVMKLLDAIYASSEQGQPVRVS
jgi:predicted dehydrogenase